MARAQPDVAQQLVTELAASVLEPIAPEELAILDDTAQEWDTWVNEVVRL